MPKTPQSNHDNSANKERLGNITGDTGNATFTRHDLNQETPAEGLAISQMLPVVLGAMMASSTDFSFVKDKDLRYVCCSRAFAHLVGLENEKEIVGKTDYDLFEKAFADQYVADDRRLMESKRSLINSVEQIPSHEERTHYSNTSKYLLYDSRGDVIGLYGTGRDITETREADSKLKLLTESIPGGLITFEYSSCNIRVLYFNDGYCKLFGYTRQEYERLSATDPSARVFKEDLPLLTKQLEELIKHGTPVDCTHRIHVNGGGYKWINQRGVLMDRTENTVTINAVLFDVTEQQEATERLRISEEEYRLATRHSGSIICRYYVADKLLVTPPEVASNFLLPEKLKNVPYEPVRQCKVSQESIESYIGFYESILQGTPTGTAIFQKLTKSGWRWFSASYSTIFSDGGEPISAIISFSDVTDQLEKEAVFKKWQQSLYDKDAGAYTLFRYNLSKDAPNDVVKGTLLHIKFTSEADTFNKKTAEYVEQYVYEEDRSRYITALNPDTLLANYYRGQRSETLEYREKLPDGDDVRWLRLSIELVEYPNSTDVEVYLMYENIDDSKKAELLTLERAETDPLTGILNRATFIANVERLLQGSTPGTKHALLMLDIDGFKQVNDAFGHGAGDHALIDIANSLNAVLRRGDLLGRLGGDEFLVFLKDVPHDQIVATKAKQMCALLRKSFSAEIHISASIGVVVYPRDGADFDKLYKRADAALYHIKGRGKDDFAFYHEGMEEDHKREKKELPITAVSVKREKKRRMLIVDDNKIDYALLSNLFKDDFLIEKAQDGASALLRLRHYGSAISVVLLDLFMPGMDGFAVLERMQSSMELQSIPVIVVSGDEERETSLRAIRLGASDFVTKPVDAELLRIRVRSAISKSENEQLRAQNSYLKLQSEEAAKYRTILEHTKTAIIEYDWINGTFAYGSTLPDYIAGNYDDRNLWHILLTDMVADVPTVRKLQEYSHEIAKDRTCSEGSLQVLLRTPRKSRHWFRINIYKQINEFQLTDKLILTLTDMGPTDPATEGL